MKKLVYIIIFLALCYLSSSAQETQQQGTMETLMQTISPLLSSQETKASQEIVKAITNQLVQEFDNWLECPECYRDNVLEECSFFPEGRIYSFAIPAMAYANLAIKDPQKQQHALTQMVKLIDLLIPIVVEDIQPPNGDLTQLVTYQDQATYLGTLNMALGSYVLIGGDTRYEHIHERISDVLYQTLVESNGESIHSYPTYTWHFDTLFALTSLHLYDKSKGLTRTEKLIEQHLQWKQQHVTHQATGLPIANASGVPRGCDISMQICLLAQFAPEVAEDLYQKYVNAHWIEHGILAGFSEWPKGSKKTSGGDFDSGPIVFNIGLTATGAGLGATQAMNDQERFNKLCTELNIVTPIKQLLTTTNKDNGLFQWFTMFAPLKAEYFSGFFYGDAILFYTLTWAPYPEFADKSPM